MARAVCPRQIRQHDQRAEQAVHVRRPPDRARTARVSVRATARRSSNAAFVSRNPVARSARRACVRSGSPATQHGLTGRDRRGVAQATRSSASIRKGKPSGSPNRAGIERQTEMPDARTAAVLGAPRRPRRATRPTGSRPPWPARSPCGCFPRPCRREASGAGAREAAWPLVTGRAVGVDGPAARNAPAPPPLIEQLAETHGAGRHVEQEGRLARTLAPRPTAGWCPAWPRARRSARRPASACCRW